MNNNSPLIRQMRDKKDIMVQTIKTQKLQPISARVKFIQQKTGLAEHEINNFLFELEKETNLNCVKKQAVRSSTPRRYIFSMEAPWYWITIAIVIAATISIFAIPENTYPIIYIRSALGLLFVLFLPGYAFVKMLFPSKVPIATSSAEMDNIERIVLSLGMSLALTSIVGLILNYTPWRIRLTPITLSLLALTVCFATVAVVREFQSKQLD